MSVIYKTRWRLVYIDGRQIDELPQGSTIMERWPDPIELHLIDITGDAKLCVPIPHGHKPIFYRQRSIEHKPQLNGNLGEPKLDATVFGYAREIGSTVDGTLWIWSGMQAMDCPPEHIAQRAIEMQLAV